MQLAAAMIDSGQIEYALVVDGEDAREVQEATIERLSRPEATADDVHRRVRDAHPRLGRRGDGAGPRRPPPGGPPGRRRRQPGRAPSTTSCASATSTACAPTQGPARRRPGAVGATCGRRPRREFDWAGHGPLRHPPGLAGAHRARSAARLGIDPDRVPRTFPTRGNIGPASVPFTLAGEVDSLADRRPGAADGHRLGPERLLPRDRLVTRQLLPRACGLPGLDPAGRGWSPSPTPTGVRAPGTSSTTASPDPSRAPCCACTATRPGRTCGGGSLAAAPPGWRVVAPDQLGMGFSERLDRAADAGRSGSTTSAT